MEVYYRWVDAEGRLHVVSSLDAVPPAARARAERIELNAREAAVPSRAADANPTLGVGGGAGGGGGAEAPHWLSFGAGFVVALALVLLFRVLPQSFRWVLRIAIVLGAAALFTALYFGALRRSTGAGAGALASPSVLLEDARNAVEQVKLRQAKQEQELRAIEEEARGKPIGAGGSAPLRRER